MSLKIFLPKVVVSKSELTEIWVSYPLFSKILKIDYLISNILSWGLSVVFAYFTNRWFVFHSKNKNKINEFLKFTGSRVLTLLLDSGLMVLGVEYLKIDDLLTKILVQIIIVISNYIISKLIVFKKEKKWKRNL